MTDANRPIIDPGTGEIIDGWVAHPAADLFPMAQADELDGLTADIAEHGLVESIWTIDDGVVLDGRNRLVACHRLGLAPTVKRYRGDDPITFAVSLNLHRRHLEKSQVAAIARESIPLYAEEARKKQAEAGKVYGRGSAGKLGAGLHQAIDEKRAPRATDRAAEAFGISGRLVGQVDRIAEQAPDLLPEIKAGTLTANAAEKILKDRQIVAQYAELKPVLDELKEQANKEAQKIEPTPGWLVALFRSADSLSAVAADVFVSAKWKPSAEKAIDMIRKVIDGISVQLNIVDDNQ